MPPMDGRTVKIPCPVEYERECCPECGGNNTYKICPECGGGITCRECHGTGLKPDETQTHPDDCQCGGSEEIETPAPQKIGCATFNGARIAWLQAIPGILIRAPKAEDGPDLVLAFVADDGVEGLLAEQRGEA